MKRSIAIGLLLLFSILIPGTGPLFLNRAAADSLPSGPTALLSYEKKTQVKNPIDVFMYSIPLTAPARVKLEKSPGNGQTAWITGYDLRNRTGEFRLRCEFTIDGNGYFINEFNHHEIIAINTRDLDRQKTITNLDYMRFEGNGFGVIEITGKNNNGRLFITDLTFDFSEHGTTSPVLIGLYSLDPVDGVYDYANRYNHFMARINSLSFQETQPGETPKMRIKLSNVGGGASPDGFFSSIKAVFANLFVAPMDINPAGNSVLIDFAKALYLKKAQFTFPLAQSLETAQ